MANNFGCGEYGYNKKPRLALVVFRLPSIIIMWFRIHIELPSVYFVVFAASKKRQLNNSFLDLCRCSETRPSASEECAFYFQFHLKLKWHLLRQTLNERRDLLYVVSQVGDNVPKKKLRIYCRFNE